jgi:uncharacterized protein (DUF433 family)
MSQIPQIESRPDKCGGRPCIAGTRIRVQDVYVWHELQGQTADEIVDQFPEISLAQVHLALAYFWDHQQEIRKEMRVDEEYVARLRSQYGSGPLEIAAASARSR